MGVVIVIVNPGIEFVMLCEAESFAVTKTPGYDPPELGDNVPLIKHPALAGATLIVVDAGNVPVSEHV